MLQRLLYRQHVARFEDARRFIGNQCAEFQAVSMSFAVANDGLHELSAILIGKDELHFYFFAQQQFDWGIA